MGAREKRSTVSTKVLLELLEKSPYLFDYRLGVKKHNEGMHWTEKAMLKKDSAQLFLPVIQVL